MKIHKMFCISPDIANRLSEEYPRTASSLVDDLLRKHFEERDFKNLSREEIEKKLAIIEIQKKHKAELEAFING